MLFLFVGERQSNTALKKNWTWRSCQIEREPRLCAIKLFESLEAVGIDPYDLESVVFANIFNEEEVVNGENVKLIRWFQECGFTVVGMGRKVQGCLDDLEIEHIGIVHPAARGEILKEGRYTEHLRERLV